MHAHRERERLKEEFRAQEEREGVLASQGVMLLIDFRGVEWNLAPLQSENLKRRWGVLAHGCDKREKAGT